MNPLNQIMEKALRRTAYTADDLIHRIKGFQVISFDLFDTLMYRRTVTPQGIFRQTALDFNRENGPESVDAASFVQDRMSAVEEAFRRAARNGWEEITFEEIYACLPEKYRSVSARLMELEKREELRAAMPNPVLQQVYDWCIRNQKEIIVVSDMYLGSEFIEQILDKCGYHGYKRLFLSSVVRMKKSTGNLFRYALAELQVRPEEIIHIGNNYTEEILTARRIGLRAVPIATLPRRTVFTRIRRMNREHRAPWRELSVLMDRSVSDAWTEETRFGFEVLGPLLYGMCSWIHRQAQEDRIEKLFFPSRDGGILQKGYRQLFGRAALPNTCFCASHRSLHVSCLWMHPEIEVFQGLFKETEKWNCVKFCDWIGLDPAEGARCWRDAGLAEEETIANGAIAANASFRAFYEKVLPAIIRCSRQEYELIFQYMDELGLRGRIAVVDIGRRGRMQQSLQQISEREKLPVHLEGYYVGLCGAADAAPEMKSYIPDSLDIEMTTGEIFEYLFTSPREGSTRRLTRDRDGMLSPELLSCEYENRKESRVLQQIRQGALFFVEEIRQWFPEIELSGGDAVENLRVIGKKPTKKTLSLLSDISCEERAEYPEPQYR